MEHENEFTGVLASVSVNERDKYKVANIELKNGGVWNEKDQKYEPYYFPLEAWLDDHIKKIRGFKEGDIITVRYRAVPRKVTIDGYKKKIIVWKVIKIQSWNEKKRPKENAVQLSFSEQVLE